MVANKTTKIKMDPGRAPLLGTSVPGHTLQPVEKSVSDNESNDLIISTSTLLMTGQGGVGVLEVHQGNTK